MDAHPASGGGNGLSLAIEALESGQVDEAIHLLQFATTANPNSAEAHYHLGRAYQARGNSALSEASFRRAVTLAPEHAPALCSLGVILAQQQKPFEARRLLEAALRSDPGCREAEEALSHLPRPEDHAALAQLLDATAAPSSAAAEDSGHPYRILMLASVMGLLLMVLLLGWVFLQARSMVGSHGSGDGSAMVTTGESAAPVPAPPTEGRSAPADLEPGASEAAPAAAGPPPAVSAYLERLYAVQQAFRAAKGRYASLAELAGSGKVSPAAASGQAVEECGGAVLSEELPTSDAFTIRAATPDGVTIAVDQDGRIAEE